MIHVYAPGPTNETDEHKTSEIDLNININMEGLESKESHISQIDDGGFYGTDECFEIENLMMNDSVRVSNI